MMKNRLYDIFMALQFCMVCMSCSDIIFAESEDIGVNVLSEDGMVTAFIPSYEYENTSQAITRTSHVFSASGMTFAWVAGDIVGYFPTSEEPNDADVNRLTYQEGNDENGGHYAYFGKSKVIGIKPGEEYTSYYRYKPEHEGVPYNAIPVSYAGQSQSGNVKMNYPTSSDKYVESEKKASKHLGDFNFMTSAIAKSNEYNASLHFDYKQVQAIARFKLQVPDAALNYSRIDLVSDTRYFVVEGTVNITDEGRSITATKTAPSMSLGLSGCDFSGDEASKADYISGGKGYIIAYMMMAPISLAQGPLMYLRGSNADGTRCFKATLTSKNLVAGKAYQWSSTLTDDSAPIIFEEITVEEWRNGVNIENQGGTGTGGW